MSTPATSGPEDQESPVVPTREGPVRGRVREGVASWLGVPYAAPPVGDLRWRPPTPAAPRDGVFEADRFGHAAPQVERPQMPLGPGVEQSEDCLYLNVWAPADLDGPAPVMVWVHGGAYMLGSASQPLYDGSVLASEGVVVVSMNYRLGALGFLDLSSVVEGAVANCGMRDVVAALEWVRGNIAGFGGDPAAVTLFGESAGAGIVTSLMTSPAAEGLFHRAIAESSPASSVYGPDRAARTASLFLELLDAEGEDLRGVPVERLVAAGEALGSRVSQESPGVIPFSPVVDGDLLPDYPLHVFREGKSHRVPLVIGTNKDEASLFKFMKWPLMPLTREQILVMFEQLRAERPQLVLPTEDQVLEAYSGVPRRAIGLGVAREIAFRLPTLWLMDGHRDHSPVWLYRFDFAPPLFKAVGLGASHATELAYVFGNLPTQLADPTYKLGGLRTGRKVSARMRSRWTSFARWGTPNPSGVDPIWPPCGVEAGEGDACLIIDATERVDDDVDAVLLDTWGREVLSFL